MKLLKTVKKVMAIGTGAAMMGATLSGGVFAADPLADYPSPYVKDGKFNGLIVFGDNANAADIAGAVDIATSLQFASRVKRSLESSGSVASYSASGEAWKVGTATKDFELSERGGGAAKTEIFYDIERKITKDELPSLLADGSISTGQRESDYEQVFEFYNHAKTGDMVSTSVVHATSENDVNEDDVGPMLFIDDGAGILNYTLEFDDNLESDITDVNGDTDANGAVLWDLEGEEIEILGKTWSILTARTGDSTSDNSVVLTLMGGSVRSTLEERNSKIYTVEGKTYEVALGIISDSNNRQSARFVVNGEETRSLRPGDTHTLKDGALIGIRDITFPRNTLQPGSVEFYLGADKIVLEDDDITNDASSDDLQVEDDSVGETEVTIKGTKDRSNFEIESIMLSISADQKIYLGAGGKLSEQLDEPQVLLGAWDIEFSGLESSTTELIKIDSAGDDQYNLEFVDSKGEKVELPFLHSPSDDNIRFGAEDDDEVLVIYGPEAIEENNYFVISDTQEDRGQQTTYAYQYLGTSKKVEGDDAELEFKNLGSGDTVKVSVDLSDINDIGELNDHTIKVDAKPAEDARDFAIKVDLRNDGFANLAVPITTDAGAEIVFGGYPGRGSSQTDATTLTISTPDADQYDNLQPSNVVLELDAAASTTDLSLDIQGGTSNYIDDAEDDDVKEFYTTLGTLVRYDTGDDPETVTITYPKAQMLPAVFITSPAAKITSSAPTEAGENVYYETNPIEVGVAVLASQVPDVAAQNVISVGGPCANAVSSQLMGNPAECSEGFEVGKAVIKLVEHTNGNVGMVVAGYSADDTTRATRVLAKYETWQDSGKLTGTEVEVTGTTFTDISVAAMMTKKEGNATATTNSTS